MKKFSIEIRNKVVEDILAGKILVKEAMVKYDILAKATIRKWVKEYKCKDYSTETKS